MISKIKLGYEMETDKKTNSNTEDLSCVRKCQECEMMLNQDQINEHTEIICLENKFEMINKIATEEINDLQKLLAYLARRINEQETFFATNCKACNKVACEVNLKHCVTCRFSFCSVCSRKKMRECNNCGSPVCTKCINTNSECPGCLKNNRITKNSKLSEQTIDIQ